MLKAALKQIYLVTWIELVPLVSLPIILLSPVLFTGKALFWGTPSTQFLPWWKWAFDTLLSGHLPLWNPLVGMGAPLIANYQSALFYPPTWIYFLFYLFGKLPALAWSQALILTCHLIWAGLGMFFLSRRLGFGRLARMVCSLAFSMSGYLVGHAWFSSVNAAISWLPWILLFSFDVVSSQKKIISFIKLTLALTLQLLSGHAQITWYTLLLATMWISYWTWQFIIKNHKSIRKRLKALFTPLGYFLISIILAAGMAAIQLIPTAEYLLQSQRATAAEYESAMTYSFWPWRIVGLLAPNLFGNPAYGDYWGYGNYWEDAIYIGLLPFLLVVGALTSRRVGENLIIYDDNHKSLKDNQMISIQRLRIFLLVIALLGFLLALGKNTPVFPWLYHYFPTFDMFRAPTRFSIWLVFSFSLLAAIGVENWRRPKGRGLYWTRLGTAGAFAVTLGAGLGWYLLTGVVTDFRPTFVPAIALTGLWGVGTGILALTAPPEVDEKNRPKSFWMWMVVLWVSADLLIAGIGLNPGINLNFYKIHPENTHEIRQFLGNGRLYIRPDDENTLMFKDYFHFESFEPTMSWSNLRATMLPNLNMLEGIPAVNNYDPLVPGRYKKWMEEIETADSQVKSEMFDLMGVTVIGTRVVNEENGVWFYKRGEVNRTQWVPCGWYAQDEESVLDSMFSGKIDLESVVILEGVTPGKNLDCSQPIVTLQLVSESPNEVIIDIETENPGWLVLSDVWYPGWKVKVDGIDEQVVRANYLFRAVPVASGWHEVVFNYYPTSLYLGAILSLVSCLGLVGFLIWVRNHN